MIVNKKKKKNLFDVVLDIILFLLGILIIYWLIQMILGGSPTLSEFNFGLIVALGVLFIKIYREVGEIRVNIKYITNGIEQGFNNIKKDMNSIKNKLK